MLAQVRAIGFALIVATSQRNTADDTAHDTAHDADSGTHSRTGLSAGGAPHDEWRSKLRGSISSLKDQIQASSLSSEHRKQLRSIILASIFLERPVDQAGWRELLSMRTDLIGLCKRVVSSQEDTQDEPSEDEAYLQRVMRDVIEMHYDDLALKDPNIRHQVVSHVLGLLSDPKNLEINRWGVLSSICMPLTDPSTLNKFGPTELEDLKKKLSQIALDGKLDSYIRLPAFLALAAMGDRTSKLALMDEFRSCQVTGETKTALLPALAAYRDEDAASLLIGLGHQNNVLVQTQQFQTVLNEFDLCDPRYESMLLSLITAACDSNHADPISCSARAAIERTLLGDRGAEFKKQLVQVRRALPRHIQVRFEEGLIAYDRARDLGISPALRVAFDLLPEIVRNRSSNTPDHRPLAVVMMGESDHNGALYETDTLVRDLIRAGYRVLTYTARTDSEFVSMLKEATAPQKADVLMIVGHGTRGAVWLDAKESDGDDPTGDRYIDTTDRNLLVQGGVGERVSSNGQVLLIACSAGEGGDTGDNVVAMLKGVLPQVRPGDFFYATEPAAIVEGLTFGPDRRISAVGFKAPQKPSP